MEGFKLLPFRSEFGNRRKATRKRSELALANGDYFPPEGHISIKLSEDLDEEEEVTHTCILFVGGARRQEEASWQFASQLVELHLAVDADDVSVEKLFKCDTHGSELSPMQSSAAVLYKDTIYMWGGINCQYLQTVNDLYMISRKKAKTYLLAFFLEIK